MNNKRWFWLVSLVTGVLVLFALLGSVTQTALMQEGETVLRKTAVSQQGPVNVASQGGNTAVNTQSVNVLIPDGSFENDPSLWIQLSNNTTCSVSIGDWSSEVGVLAYDGNQYFWGGGYCPGPNGDVPVNNTASMTVTIPPDTPAISFWYWAEREDPDVFEDFAYVEAEVIDVGTYTLWSYALELANNTNGWVKETLDLSDFAGQEIILRFSVEHGTSQYAGNLFVDFVEFAEPGEQTWNVDPRSGGFFQYTTASGAPVTDFTIPPGAVDQETIISYKSATSAGFPLYPAGESPLGVSLNYAGLAFDLEAYDEFLYLPMIINNNATASVAQVEGSYEAASIESIEATNSFQFNNPIKVTIHYDQAKLDELGIDEKSVYLYYWTGDGWADAALSCDQKDYIDPPSTTYFRDTQGSYPLIVYAYSALMNLFVPSAGSKWLIEAPYLLPAGASLDVSPVTVLLAYSYGDSTTNLIQPFFAIPILSVTRLRFGDVVGYTFLIACACFAVSVVAMLLISPNL